MQRTATAAYESPKLPRPTVPEGPIEPPAVAPVPPPARELTTFDEFAADLSRRGTGNETRQQIIDMFPGKGISREAARDLARAAFGDEWMPGNKRPGVQPPPEELPPAEPVTKPTPTPPAAPEGTAKATPTPAEIVKMTPAEFLDWAKKNKWGGEKAREIAGKLTPEERQNLQDEYNRIRSQMEEEKKKIAAMALKTEAGEPNPARLEAITEYQALGFKLQSLGELVREKPTLPEEPAPAAAPVETTPPASTVPRGTPTFEDTEVPGTGKPIGHWETAKTAADLPKGEVRAWLAKWLAVPNQPNRILQALANQKRTREIHSPPSPAATPIPPKPPTEPEAPARTPVAKPTPPPLPSAPGELLAVPPGLPTVEAERSNIVKLLEQLQEEDDKGRLSDRELPEGQTDALWRQAADALGKDWGEVLELDQSQLIKALRDRLGEIEQSKMKGRPVNPVVPVKQAPNASLARIGTAFNKDATGVDLLDLVENEISDNTNSISDELKKAAADYRRAIEEDYEEGNKLEPAFMAAVKRAIGGEPAPGPTPPVAETKPAPIVGEFERIQAEQERLEAARLKSSEFGGPWDNLLKTLTPVQRDRLNSVIQDPNYGLKIQRILLKAVNAGEVTKANLESKLKAAIAEAGRSLQPIDVRATVTPVAPVTPQVTSVEIERVGGDPTHPLDLILYKLGKTLGMVKMPAENSWQTPTITRSEFQKLTVEADKVGWLPDGYIDVKGKGVKVFFKPKPTPEQAEIQRKKARISRLEIIAENQPESADLANAEIKRLQAEVDAAERKTGVEEGIKADREAKTNPKPGDMVNHPDFGDVRVLSASGDSVAFEQLSGPNRGRQSRLPLKEWREDLGVTAPPATSSPGDTAATKFATEYGGDAFDVDRLSKILGMSQDEWKSQSTRFKNSQMAGYLADKTRLLAMEDAIDAKDVAQVADLFRSDTTPDKNVRRLFSAITKARTPGEWEDSLKPQLTPEQTKKIALLQNASDLTYSKFTADLFDKRKEANYKSALNRLNDFKRELGLPVIGEEAGPSDQWKSKVGLEGPIRPAPSKEMHLPPAVEVQGQLYEFNPEEVKKANLACRVCGAVGGGAITPKYVRQTSSRTETILDFGAGDQAPHTKTLKEEGFNVTAYEFGQNVVEGIHDPDALSRKYDTVFASNVLNVQSGRPMLRATLKEIFDATEGRALFNYPRKPRYSALSTTEVAGEIKSIFGVDPTRVGGTPDAPIWEVRTDGKASAATTSKTAPAAQPRPAAPEAGKPFRAQLPPEMQAKADALKVMQAQMEEVQAVIERHEQGRSITKEDYAKAQEAMRSANELNPKINSLSQELFDYRWAQETQRFRGQAEPEPSKPKITTKILKAQKENLIEQLDDAIKDAPESGKGKITISVPGDGEFTLHNTKEALKKFKTIADEGASVGSKGKKLKVGPFPVTVQGQKEAGLPKVKSSAMPAAVTPKPEDLPKVVTRTNSDDPSREAINSAYSDGTQIISTDGRQLLRVVSDKAPGTPAEPVRINSEGKVDKGVTSNYPNFQQVISSDPTLVMGGLKTDGFWHMAKQAQVFAASYGDKGKDASVHLFLNADRSIGGKVTMAGGDTFEHNLQPGAKGIGTVQQQLSVRCDRLSAPARKRNGRYLPRRRYRANRVGGPEPPALDHADEAWGRHWRSGYWSG